MRHLALVGLIGLCAVVSCSRGAPTEATPRVAGADAGAPPASGAAAPAASTPRTLPAGATFADLVRLLRNAPPPDPGLPGGCLLEGGASRGPTCRRSGP